MSKRNIDVALVKEFYANIYDPEDSLPKQRKVRGKVIQFDAQMLNTFLETPSRRGVVPHFLLVPPHVSGPSGHCSEVVYAKRPIYYECRRGPLEDSVEGLNHSSSDMECPFLL